MPLGWVYNAWGGLLSKYGLFHVPIWRVHHSKKSPSMDPILSKALPSSSNEHSKA